MKLYKNIVNIKKLENVFQITLLVFIVISISAVLIDSVKSLSYQYQKEIYLVEVICSLFFTFEYITRIFIAKRKLKYMLSFMGLIDLIAIIPFYIGLFDIDATSISIIRSIRFIRIFRVLKLAQFMGQQNILIKALRDNVKKIIVFLVFVSVVLLIFGSIMYVIEGEEGGFTSIPKSIYWAVVTMTTVGYGDIAPKTITGQFLSSIIMILGYGIIAVPTGIVINDIREKKIECKACNYRKNLLENQYCGNCGEKIK